MQRDRRNARPFDRWRSLGSGDGNQSLSADHHSTSDADSMRTMRSRVQLQHRIATACLTLLGRNSIGHGVECLSKKIFVRRMSAELQVDRCLSTAHEQRAPKEVVLLWTVQFDVCRFKGVEETSRFNRTQNRRRSSAVEEIIDAKVSCLQQNPRRYAAAEGALARRASRTQFCVSLFSSIFQFKGDSIGIFSPTNRCYLCGEKFVLAQELSRHIRDNVCQKSDDASLAGEETSSVGMTTISMIELPIINLCELETTSTATTMAADCVEMAEEAEECLDDDENVFTEVEQLEIPLDEWGCKQCDFKWEEQKKIFS